MNKTLAGIALIILTLAPMSAQSWLVRVPLTTQGLDPLFDQNLRIVAQTEHNALVLATPAELADARGLHWEILDQNPDQHEFYLVLLLDANLDLSRYGTILMQEEQNVLLRLFPGGLEELMRGKVMLKKVFLRPIIRSSQSFEGKIQVNPVIQEIVDRVSSDSVLGFVRRLQNFRTRYSTHDSCFAAANWLASRFLAYGCDTVYLQNHTSGHAPNVIAVRRGVLYPDSIYAVICGHFDSYSSAGQNNAPGADDNASGSAAALEAARVMKDYDFEYSARFLAFSGEEFGLYGSEYYAQQAYSRGDAILGVFNGDMIAYVDHLPESLEVITRISNPPCDPLANFFIACADTYTILLTHKQLTSNWQPSDNQSFLDYGYPALLNIEDFYPSNPYYHTAGDSIGTGYNNNLFATEVTKAEIAALATMIRPWSINVQEPSFAANRSDQKTIWATPNPFKTTTTLNFVPAQTGEIKIYDRNGRMVRHLTAPGVWHGDDDQGRILPAGVYFIRIPMLNQTLVPTVIKLR